MMTCGVITNYHLIIAYYFGDIGRRGSRRISQPFLQYCGLIGCRIFAVCCWYQRW